MINASRYTLGAMFTTVVGLLLLIASAANFSMQSGSQFNLVASIADTGFCQDDKATICTVEVQSRGNIDFEELSFQVGDSKIAIPDTAQSFESQLEAQSLQLTLNSKEVIEDTIKVYQPTPLADLYREQARYCLDIKQTYYLKLPEGMITNDDGTFVQDVNSITAYDCFVDEQERSDYLDNSILYQLID